MLCPNCNEKTKVYGNKKNENLKYRKCPSCGIKIITIYTEKILKIKNNSSNSSISEKHKV